MPGDCRAEFTCTLVEELSREFHKILSDHPINRQRQKEGLSPANLILFRGAGSRLRVSTHINFSTSFYHCPLLHYESTKYDDQKESR
jgi:2,3-bisphosphoglycerate-independent phosphoglycerate mutase